MQATGVDINILKLLQEKADWEEQGEKQDGHNAQYIANHINSGLFYVRNRLGPLKSNDYIKVHMGYYNITKSGSEVLKAYLTNGVPIEVEEKKVSKKSIPLLTKEHLKASDFYQALSLETHVAKTLPIVSEDVFNCIVIPLLALYLAQNGETLPVVGDNLDIEKAELIRKTIPELIDYLNDKWHYRD